MTAIIKPTEANNTHQLAPTKVLKPLMLTITALAGLALLGVAIAYGTDLSSLKEHIFSSGPINLFQSPGHIAVGSIEGAAGGLVFLGASRELYKKATKAATFGQMMGDLKNKISAAGFKISDDGKALSHPTLQLDKIEDPNKKELLDVLNWEAAPSERNSPMSEQLEDMYSRVISTLNRLHTFNIPHISNDIKESSTGSESSL